jgi:hypothetical protein
MDNVICLNFNVAKAALSEEISLDDFWSHLPNRKFIFAPTGTLWPAESVNVRLPGVPITVTGDDGTTKEKLIPPSFEGREAPTAKPGAVLEGRNMLRAAVHAGRLGRLAASLQPDGAI